MKGFGYVWGGGGLTGAPGGPLGPGDPVGPVVPCRERNFTDKKQTSIEHTNYKYNNF